MKEKRIHFSGSDHVVPELGSRGWKRVVARGCGGRTYDTMDGPDFTCDHGYTWTCEECPWGVEAMEREQQAWEDEHPGPPRPEHLRPKGRWWCPSVATELVDEPQAPMHSAICNLSCGMPAKGCSCGLS